MKIAPRTTKVSNTAVTDISAAFHDGPVGFGVLEDVADEVAVAVVVAVIVTVDILEQSMGVCRYNKSLFGVCVFVILQNK